MWLKDGSLVEVLRKKHGAYGSWFPAKIVSKIGWFVYTVRYELYMTKKGGAVEEDVHERDIRPCPLIAGEGENWVIGDVAEVFDLRSWRVGRIVKVLNENYFVIRLLGSDRWILLGKLRSLFDDAVASECPFCGYLMIREISLPFVRWEDAIYVVEVARYDADFEQDKEMLKWILSYLDATKASLLTHLLNEGGPVNIAYMNFDWSLNS